MNFFYPIFRNSEQDMHFRALTGLRMIAASLVFFYHNRKYWRGNLHPELIRFFNEGHLGVTLFFVLSGFLIAYNYSDKPLATPKAFFRYFALRTARIIPLYWLILSARYLDWGFPSAGSTFSTYFLIHAFSNRFNLDAIAQAWTLNVEFCYYFLAPLLYLFIRKSLLMPFIACLAVSGIAIFTGIGWHWTTGNPMQVLYPLNFVLESTFFGRFPEFLWGMALASYMSGNKKLQFLLPQKYRTGIGFAGFFGLIYLTGLLESKEFVHGTDHPLGMALRATLIPWLIICLLHGLITEKSMLQRFLGCAAMEVLGKASFAFYLIHISYVSIQLREFILLPDRNFFLLWGIALVFYWFLEKPSYGFLKKQINRRSAE